MIEHKPTEHTKPLAEPIQEEIKQEVIVENGPASALMLPGSVILAGLLIAGSVIFAGWQLGNKLSSGNIFAGAVTGGNQQQGQTGGQQPPAGPVKITLKPDTPFLGNKNAKVTVVEFADYQCPYCEQWYKTVYPELKSKYIDTGKIKFIYQDFAFLGADSTTAAEAAHCAADQGKFWQYHDYLFSNQGQENTGWATADKQKSFAATLGLNTGKFNQCLDSHKFAQQVQDETSAGKSYGVTGTPTIFINGVPTVGAQPVNVFTAAIDAALK